MGKAATAKAKAAAKKKAMADGDYNSDDEDDEYTAPSTRKTAPKPQPGSFENCARCSKQFTVVSLNST
jgi:DNA repair protein RAD7